MTNFEKDLHAALDGIMSRPRPTVRQSLLALLITPQVRKCVKRGDIFRSTRYNVDTARGIAAVFEKAGLKAGVGIHFRSAKPEVTLTIRKH